VYVVDSSVWVLAAGRRVDIEVLAGSTMIAVCPAVVEEFLRGSQSLSRYRLAQRMFRRLTMLDAPTPLERFEEAARLYMICRDAGVTPRKGYDCLIAATALAHGAAVLHRDSDFDEIARVLPLKAKRV
jgi:hypothetical protein